MKVRRGKERKERRAEKKETKNKQEENNFILIKMDTLSQGKRDMRRKREREREKR